MSRFRPAFSALVMSAREQEEAEVQDAITAARMSRERANESWARHQCRPHPAPITVTLKSTEGKAL